MKLPEGTFVVGNKLMTVCGICGKIVRIDKPFFGAFHFCVTEEETWKTAGYDISQGVFTTEKQKNNET